MTKIARDVPVFDALRLAVAYRLNRGDGAVLATIAGVPLATLEHFVETGEIGERDRIVLETMQ